MKNTSQNVRTVVGFLAYGLGLLAMNYLSKAFPGSVHRYWLILLPVIPIIYLGYNAIRSLAGQDEMWRKIVTESLAFSAVATGFTCCTLFFFRAVDAPVFPAQWVFLLLIAYYLIGNLFLRRRYL